jgi:hypothetical protein
MIGTIFELNLSQKTEYLNKKNLTLKNNAIKFYLFVFA